MKTSRLNVKLLCETVKCETSLTNQFFVVNRGTKKNEYINPKTNNFSLSLNLSPR